MDLQLKDTVVAITGAGSGIGQAAAQLLASEGAHVALIDLDLASAQAVVDDLPVGTQAIAVQADVSDDASVQNAMQSIAAHFGVIDHLVLCAGISIAYGKTPEQVTSEQWDKMFGVNVRGQWLPVKYGLAALRRSTQNPAIAIVASDSALFASPLHTPYCCTEAAVLMLTKCLVVDLREDGIRVNCVCPSVVDTRQSRDDLGIEVGGHNQVDYPVHTASDIARYLMLLISPVTATINAHPLVADFGYSAQSNFPA